MAGLVQQNEFRSRNRVCDNPAVRRRYQAIGISVDHQGGRGDLAEAAIGLPAHDSHQLGHESLGRGLVTACQVKIRLDSIPRRMGVVDEGHKG